MSALGPSGTSVDIEKAEVQNNRQSEQSLSSASSVAPSVDIISISHQRSLPQNNDDIGDLVVIERQRTATSIYAKTVGSTRESNKSTVWPDFGGGKSYPPPLPNKADYVVDFAGPEDPLHGQNWPLKKKLVTAAILGYTTFVAAWGSSIFSSATNAVHLHFGVTVEVSILGTSLYVLGFAVGPLVWAPFSELKGRRLPIILGIFGFSIFQIAVAVAKDIQTVFLSRFWSGVFAASPITIVGAVFTDIFNQETRGSAIAVFVMMVFCGPLLAPIAGGYIIDSTLGWRWTEYITAIMGFLAFGLCLFFVPESYPPVILVEKASHIRRLTKNWSIHAQQEEIQVDFKELVQNNFGRPLKLLISEPIVFVVSLYTAFVYAILYLFLVSFPVVYQQLRGWSAGVGSLPYLGMVVGMSLGGVMEIAFQPWMRRRLVANGGKICPEDRLIPCMIGSILFPIGIFWFAWAGNDPTLHWIVPVLAGVPLGMGLVIIFLQCINYLVDAYLIFAASAIAANTCLRSVFAAGFPLLGRIMFLPHPLGVGWAASLLGFIAVAMVPIPIVLYLFGERIRKLSKWAPT